MGNPQLPGQLPPVTLPIEAALPALLAALQKGQRAVLQAPPGAGKTTMVPLALLDQPWLKGKRIILLEPRRLAARAAAARMAALLGESVGARVGYRMRQDSKLSRATRILVVTEGILGRMVQDDPALDGVGAVLFDEFHERHLTADLGLALCLDLQAGLRPDLRLLVMSATLDGARVARMLDDAPIIDSPGRSFPVELRHLPRPESRALKASMAATIRDALAEQLGGDILAFLPGQAEIRAVGRMLGDVNALVVPLFGDLSQAEQDRALRPVPGRRKVVLATAIAETSLTIEGVTIVVDSGLMRVPRFDPNGGMTRLVTLPVAKSSADQRAGRAGRTQAGICYRLWSEAEHRGLAPFPAPEITEADLAPLALDLLRWGVTDPSTLRWLDPPPEAAYRQALALLADLQAIDDTGRITAEGRAMAELPVHPRLGRMMRRGGELGLGGLASTLAALLSERDILKGAKDADLRRRVDALLGATDPDLDPAALGRVRDLARQLRNLLGAAPPGPDKAAVGLLLAFAYPDLIAQRRTEDAGGYRLANGRGAVLADADPLGNHRFLAVADLDGARQDARIYLAAALDQADLETHFADQIIETDRVLWDKRSQAVTALRQTRLGAVILSERPIDRPEPERVVAAQLQGIRDLGVTRLPWSAQAVSLRQRVAFLAHHQPDGWPDWSDQGLSHRLEEWLGPHLTSTSRSAHWERLDLAEILLAGLDWSQRQALDREAPTHLTVPTGSQIALDYHDPAQPVLAVRLQEMFGLAETPSLLHGTVPVLLHLLSPARRPVQVTKDLGGFWRGSYRAVKADLKGQYPKHPWPDDPLQAAPTAKAKPRN